MSQGASQKHRYGTGTLRLPHASCRRGTPDTIGGTSPPILRSTRGCGSAAAIGTPASGAEAKFGILGGTDDFSNARGEVILVITPEGDIDSTFDLEIDSERRHGKFTAQ